MKLRTTMLAAAATLAIAPAANAYEGLYGAIGAGLSYYGYENDVSNDSTAGAGATIFDTDSDYDNGVGLYGAIGYAVGNGWRTELEYAYRRADIDQLDPQAGVPAILTGSINGDTTVHSGLINVLYDFQKSGPVTPYIGAGVGIAAVDHDIAGASPGFSVEYGPSYTTLAYQGIAGVAVELAEGLALDLSYRYFAAKSKGIAARINGAPGALKADANSHNFFAGLRWDFGEAAAPAIQYKDCWDGSSVPVSAECPPQIDETLSASLDPIQFVVYFDYDKSNLSGESANLVREAASRALENDVDTVVVAGNTDTSGSSAYNQALSERRARVVRDALIANGIPADSIVTEAYGETNPAKPTPDGTREPLNRRSEVVISFVGL